MYIHISLHVTFRFMNSYCISIAMQTNTLFVHLKLFISNAWPESEWTWASNFQFLSYSSSLLLYPKRESFEFFLFTNRSMKGWWQMFSSHTTGCVLIHKLCYLFVKRYNFRNISHRDSNMLISLPSRIENLSVQKVIDKYIANWFIKRFEWCADIFGLQYVSKI